MSACPQVTVVGLGPAGPELLTSAALRAIEQGAVCVLRTRRHPAAEALPDARSFDAVYEHADTLEDVYETIVEELVATAREHGKVVYAVPGSPAVAERTVEALRAAAGAGSIELEIIPAMSFLDLAWDRLGIDPLVSSVRLVDGHRFATEAAGERGPLLVAQCDNRLVLSDIKLAAEPDPTTPVVVLQRLGLPDEVVTTVTWVDLDREIEPDHLTSLYVAKLDVPVAGAFVALDELVSTLRRECPWDREQTHASLTRYLIEETYEAVDALEALDVEAGTGFEHLEEELGDVLFQVAFHAVIATEEGQFGLADVARTVHDKLYRRHPHVFADVEVAGSSEVVRNWEQIKAAEKGRHSVMEGLPAALPSLLYAGKVQKRAASLGLDPPDLDVARRAVEEELAEVLADPSSEEVGDLLFAVVRLARHVEVDPETALRSAAQRFRDRFVHVESAAARDGIDLTTADKDVLDRLWAEAKRHAG